MVSMPTADCTVCAGFLLKLQFQIELVIRPKCTFKILYFLNLKG